MAFVRNVNVIDYVFAVFPNNLFRIQSRDSYYYYSYSHQYSIFKGCIFFTKHYNLQTKLFVDIVASDFPQNKSRFMLSYNFFSLVYNMRWLVSCVVHNNAKLCSITQLIPSANGYEREIGDLFGIAFRGHADMRRILTDYGFVGHPLKKDYPLSGFVEVRYDEHYKCIRYNAVQLVQEYRYWSFENPGDFYARAVV